MKLKLDENLSRQLKGPISQQGHDVSTALEEGLLGKVDVEVGAAAKSEDRSAASSLGRNSSIQPASLGL